MTAIDPIELRTDTPLYFPTDPEYVAATAAWNCAVEQRPVAVAVPHDVAQVVEVVRAAAAIGLSIAPQCTGHGADAIAGNDLRQCLLLRLHKLTGVIVDPELGIARIAGGTTWNEVLAATTPHGFTALHGSAGDIGVVGYLLGGGLSFYGRRHGLATSSVLSLDVVTADGLSVTASPTSHPELFWALLGGGGNFGVVVGVEISLLPIADVVAGMLLWDLSEASRVLRAWSDWTRSLPCEVGTALRLMRFPPLPELPPFLSGRNVIVIDGALLTDDPAADALLAPLRAQAPEIDTFARIPAARLVDVHMDPPTPTPIVAETSLLGPLTGEAQAALLSAAGPEVETPLMFAEVRHLGGALAEPVDAALTRLEADYALLAVAAVPGPGATVAADRAVRATVEALAPWSTGSRYANFHGSHADTQTCFDPASWERLRRVRDLYDPSGRWIGGHPIR